MSTKQIRLSVRIKYKRSKASGLLVDDPQGWMSILRPDLSAMGLSHPKQKQTMLVESGCLEFFWNTCIHGVFYNEFYNRLVHSPADGHAKMLQSLSIRWISLKDLSVDDPLPVPYAPRSRVKQERRSIDHSPPVSSPRVPKMEVAEPTPPILPGRGFSTPPPTPHFTPSPRQTVIPQPVAISATPSNSETPRGISTPTGLLHPDAEVITPHLPTNRPSLKRTASVDISPLDRRPPNPGNTHAIHITQRLKARPANLAVPRPPSAGHTDVLPAQRMSSPNGSPVMASPPSGTRPAADHPSKAQPALKRPASVRTALPNRQPINPAEVQARPDNLLESVPPLTSPRPRKEADDTQQPVADCLPPSPPLESSIVLRKFEEIEALLRDERDLRRKAETEKAVVAKLQTMNQATQVGLNVERKYRNELILRAAAERSLMDAENALAHERSLRIQVEKGLHDTRIVLKGDQQLRINVEQRLVGVKEELHHKRQSRITAEQRLAGMEEELRHERQLRTKTENYLMDIERECRHPFVVPAMLSAFKIVSELTSQSTTVPKP